MSDPVTISFDRAAHLYDRTRGLPEEIQARAAELIVETTAATTSETRFFEHGIGSGRIALPLVRRGFDFTGVDVSVKMLEQLRANLEPQHAARLHLHTADIRALPFEHDSFDVAISAHVLHLVPEWEVALDELIRVLRPGGTLCYCHEPHDESGPTRSMDRKWKQILARLGHDASSPGAWGPQVIDTLTHLGDQVQRLQVGSWDRPITRAGLLVRYEHRTNSPEWSVPEALYQPALEELQDWASTKYPSPDEPLVDPGTFEIIFARFGAQSSAPH